MGELDNTLVRMVQLCFATILFGVPLFSVYGPHEILSRTRQIVAIACAGMTAASIAAVILQTASLTDTSVTIPDVVWYLTDTRIGNIYIFRFVALVGYFSLVTITPITAVRGKIQGLVGAGLLGSFAWVGHGADSMGHALADLVHILAAGTWFGALVALCVLLFKAHRDPALVVPTARSLEMFSRIGVAVVSVLIASGVTNALFAIPLWDGSSLVGSEYGKTVLLKLVILAVMVLLAALNRYKLAPQLTQSLGGAQSQLPLKYLRQSVLFETSLAVIVLTLAAHLASTSPPGI